MCSRSLHVLSSHPSSLSQPWQILSELQKHLSPSYLRIMGRFSGSEIYGVHSPPFCFTPPSSPYHPRSVLTQTTHLSHGTAHMHEEQHASTCKPSPSKSLAVIQFTALRRWKQRLLMLQQFSFVPFFCSSCASSLPAGLGMIPGWPLIQSVMLHWNTHEYTTVWIFYLNITI